MSDEWDVDSYKTDYECDEHWELRRNFMLAHKDKLPEDELVCMAQVFTNIEFMGCRYPNATMARVAELAKGVVEEFREKRKNNLKRTFVAASDAASARAKGLARPKEEKATEISKEDEIKVIHQTNTSTVNTSLKRKLPCDIERTKKTKYGGAQTFNISRPQDSKTGAKVLNIKKLPGPFSDFVLFLYKDHPVSTLTRNGSLNKQDIRWDFSVLDNNQTSCQVFLNNVLLAEECGDGKKDAKEKAAQSTLTKLQEMCYTVKVKENFFSDSTVCAATLNNNPTKLKEEELGQDNIGRKLLKLMGWKGGGLGSQQQGISEPITAALKVSREGLGSSDQSSGIQQFKKSARDYIRTWMESNSDQDLVFSNEFCNDERKALHELASCFSLKSKSYGKNETRHLVISKKTSCWEVVEELIRLGGVSDKYELSYPAKLS